MDKTISFASELDKSARIVLEKKRKEPKIGDFSFFQQQAKDEIERSINELRKEHEKSNY